jgi:hypothetical protein
VAIHQSIYVKLWTLYIHKITLFTSVVLDANLSILIKGVEPMMERIFQVSNVPIMMKTLPRVDTLISLAKLQNEQQ